MGYQFIPDGDAAFASMAEKFARAIAQDPGCFKLSGEDAALIVRAAEDFRRALAAANNKSLRSDPVIREKDRLRGEAEHVIRRAGKRIRADESIDPIDKMRVGIKERPKKLKPRKCPQTAPLLTFKGSVHADLMREPVHVLEFIEEPHRDLVTREIVPTRKRGKAPGSDGIELYVELVEEGEPMPNHPGELSGGRPWYLRKFTSSPFKVTPPTCKRPMMVVYWACWVNQKGERGPFSKTCTARVEGWSSLRAALPDPADTRRRQQRITITTVRPELPEPIEQCGQIEATQASAPLLLELAA